MKTKNNNINADLRKKLITAIIISLFIVIGVPLIIVGATNSSWAILGIGIALTVISFYGTPLMWVSYMNYKTLKNVVDVVMEEHLSTVAEVARQLQIRERHARDYISLGIKKKYITGYIFDGFNLTANEKEGPKKKIVKNKCPNCGATLQIDDLGKYYCPYCNSAFEKE